ncbi:MAG TPA: tetratricopeptide repeat protein, partial [Chitinophagaceae bacterium]|nr:tetratricopeptide repeat protein [Chitinophagaceae bacterium]
MRQVLIFLLLISSIQIFAQPGKKPVTQEKPPTQADMNKLMEDAMKGMSEEEKAEMRKMMKDVMPAMMEQNSKMADYPEFTSNKELVPKKDMVRINAIPKKKLLQADMGPYAANLYTKLMTKGDAAEIAIVKKVIAQSPKANDLGSAAILCMMQGHPQAAMALSMKAVQLEPANATLQNNLASLLTQYGYPEQAIPILDKLKKEFPDNSTVLNNLGQAWFGLGDLDSAKKFTGLAIRVNPFHPEAKVCGGLIEELSGDPVKAEKDYTEAMENSPNPFIEKILKNKAGSKGIEKIDFEKLKRSITIYEYFPKDWITIPKLSDNVSGYENDKSIKNGYTKMFEELEATIETMAEASNAEVNNLMEKGEDEFIKGMGKEAIKGLNVMSKTAVTVQMLLQIYFAKWGENNVKDYAALVNMTNAK